MPPAVICYAGADAELAEEIGAYLKVNLALEPMLDEGRIGAGRDLFDVTGRALSSEVAVVLLSPDSVPARWVRARWEPALIHEPREFSSHLVFVLARDCKFPELLRRQNFADCSADRLTGLRALKRRLLARRAPPDHYRLPKGGFAEPPAGFETMRRELADKPGIWRDAARDAALAFAYAAGDEFEGVFWLDVTRRSRAGVLGDTAHALGLRLSGSADSSERGLREFLLTRRCLLVFENLGAPEVAEGLLGGFTSIVLSTATERPRLSPQEIASRMSRWSKDPEECARFLGDAHRTLEALSPTSNWQAMLDLGSNTLALLKHFDRLAEADEILSILIEAAGRANDTAEQRHFLGERSWIYEHWGEPHAPLTTAAVAAFQYRQLSLDLYNVK